YGIHSFKKVEKAEGGREQKGGVTEYAGKVGKSRQSIQDYTRAAEVYLAIPENLPDVRQVLMELVTSNNQGELSPLEYGIHALKKVRKADGGRGKKGGLSEYADQVGRKKQSISDYAKAAEVFLVGTENRPDIRTVLADPKADRTYHLKALHKLP